MPESTGSVSSSARRLLAWSIAAASAAAVAGAMTVWTYAGLIETAGLRKGLLARPAVITGEAVVCLAVGLFTALMLAGRLAPMLVWTVALAKLALFAGALWLLWPFWRFILDPNGATLIAYALLVLSGLQAALVLAAATQTRGA